MIQLYIVLHARTYTHVHTYAHTYTYRYACVSIEQKLLSEKELRSTRDKNN